MVKIAIITEDGVHVSKHFGRAPHYMVVEIEGNTVKGKRLVPKVGHSQFQGMHEERHEEPHLGSESKHATMSEPIKDCVVLICGGMGMGAYQSLLLRGIRPIITEVDDINQAIAAYLDGKLDDHPEYLH